MKPSSFLPSLYFLAVLSGCSLVAGLGDFEKVDDEGDAGAGADAPRCGDGRTLCAQLRNFLIHAEDTVFVELVTRVDQTDPVNPETPDLIARAVLDPFSRDRNPEAKFAMPLAMPERREPVDVQIWADVTRSGDLDQGVDHHWIRPDGEPGIFEGGELNFSHPNIFDPLQHPPTSRGGDFLIRLEDVAAHVGMMLEVHVIEAVSRRTVGLYRLQRIPEGEFPIGIEGIIEVGARYEVAMYVDVNGNDRYDAPPIDHAYLLPGLVARDEGLLLDDEPFVLSDDARDFTDVELLNP